MIVISITRADLVLPRYLYHVLRNIKWDEIEYMHGMSKFSYAKTIKMRREQDEEQMRLEDLCKVVEVDRSIFNQSNGEQIALMRGDITIDENNEVKINE